MPSGTQGIVVSIEAKIEGWQAQVKQIQDALKQLKPGSNISKDLNKELNSVLQLINNLGKNMNQRLTSDSQITSFTDKLRNVEEIFNGIGQRMSSISFGDIDPSFITNNFKDLLDQIQLAEDELSSGMTASFQQAIGESTNLKKALNALNIDPSQMGIDEVRETLKARTGDLIKEIDETNEKISSMRNEVKALKQDAQELSKLKIMNIQDRQAEAKNIVGNTAQLGSKEMNTQYLKELENRINNVLINGGKTLEDKLKDKKDQVDQAIKDLVNAQSVQEARQKIQELEDLFASVKAKGVFDKGIKIDTVTDDKLTTWIPSAQEVQTKLDKIKQVLATYSIDPNSIKFNIKDLLERGQFDELTKQIGQALENAYNTTDIQANKIQERIKALLADIKSNESEVITKGAIRYNAEQGLEKYDALIARVESENEQLKSHVAELEKQLQSETTRYIKDTGSKIQNTGAQGMVDATSQAQAYEAQLGRVKSAEQALGKLQGVVQRWFSIYAVIRMVTNAIKQVLSTLKELDSTITEIAIVTKMSQSDLWNQMGSYTDMARKYAASISGVYKVSQLYYQQGLQTADVMALTEQTLKMARISGLDYAEATDYMTNAVRSFKMEMQEAQTVVDVYSAVAASSATSVTELASAMSKTASSAQAVGASFQNTTAMMAVMIEATRESPENIGSAMKSIISRYGELKENKIGIDSEGEEYSLNKVDTALQSVGISAHDAAGEFRNFDDVIMELASKWDTIDTNTQRYIATVMAGNRQQSRFLALVSSYDRLKELSAEAANSEEASQLQYLKTLDSINAKTQQLETSIQALYTNSGLEGLYKGLLDRLNDILTTFDNVAEKMGTVGVIAKIGSIFTTLATLITNVFTTVKLKFSMMQAEMTANVQLQTAKQIEQEKLAAWSRLETETATLEELKRAESEYYAAKDKLREADLQKENIASQKAAKKGMKAGMLFSTAGLAATTIAASMDVNKQREAKAITTGLGGVLQGVGTGMMMGGVPGAIMGAMTALPSIIEAIGMASESTSEKVNRFKQELNDLHNKTLKSKDDYKTLADYKDKLLELESAQYDSDEAKQEYLKLSNEIAEKYPELISYIDEEGNKIVSLTRSYTDLLNVYKEIYNTDAHNERLTKIRNAFDKDTRLEELGITTVGDGGGDFGERVLSGWNKLTGVKFANTNRALNYFAQSANYNGGFAWTLKNAKNHDDVTDWDYMEALFGTRTHYSKTTNMGFDISNGLQYATTLTDEQKEALANYNYGLISADEQLGRVLDTLIEAGEDRNTINQIFSTIMGKEVEINKDLYTYAYLTRRNQDVLEKGQDNVIKSMNAESFSDTVAQKNIEFDSSFQASFMQDLYQKQWEEYYNKHQNDGTIEQIWDDFDLQIEKNVDKVLELYKTIINNISSSDQLDTVEHFFNNLSSYSYKEALDVYNELLSQNLPEELLNYLKTAWNDNANQIRENFKQSMQIKSQANNIEFSDSILHNLSFYLDPSFLSTLPKLYEQLFTTISPDKDKLISLFNDLLLSAGKTTDKEQQNAILQAIKNTDFTSLSEIYELSQKLVDIGADQSIIDNLSSISTLIQVNFNTEFNTLLENYSNGIESLTKDMSSISKGMDFSKALEMANQLNVTMDAFTQFGDKFYLEDLDALKDYYIKANDKYYEALKENIEARKQAYEQLNNGNELITTEHFSINKYIVMEDKNEREAYYNRFKDQIDAYMEGWSGIKGSSNFDSFEHRREMIIGSNYHYNTEDLFGDIESYIESIESTIQFNLNQIIENAGYNYEIIEKEIKKYENSLIENGIDVDTLLSDLQTYIDNEDYSQSFAEYTGNKLYENLQVIIEAQDEATEALLVSTRKALNDNLLKQEHEIDKAITEELEKLASAKTGDRLNLTQTFSLLDPSRWDEILQHFGAQFNDGILEITDASDIPSIIKAITAEVQNAGQILPDEIAQLNDAIQKAINDIADLIKDGISGSLSFSDRNNLESWATDYGITLNFTKTAEGFKLTQESAFRVYNTLSKIDALQAKLVLDDLNESLKESNEQYKDISDIMAHIVDLNKKMNAPETSEARKQQYEEELKVAKEILAIRSATQEEDSFNFMSNDIPAAQNNPLNYYNNWIKGWNTLTDAFKKSNQGKYSKDGKSITSGFIDYKDWVNLVNEMNNVAKLGGEFEIAGMKLDGSLESASRLIEAGASSLVATDTGEVKVALNGMALNFENGTDEFSDGVDSGIKALAKAQIKMLDGLISMLEAIQSMQELNIDENGDNKIAIGEIFDFDNDGKLKDKVTTLLTFLNTSIAEINVDGQSLNEALFSRLSPEELSDFFTQLNEIITDPDCDPATIKTRITALVQSFFPQDTVEVNDAIFGMLSFDRETLGSALYDSIISALKDGLSLDQAQKSGIISEIKKQNEATGTLLEQILATQPDISFATALKIAAEISENGSITEKDDKTWSYTYDGKEHPGYASEEAARTALIEQLKTTYGGYSDTISPDGTTQITVAGTGFVGYRTMLSNGQTVYSIAGTKLKYDSPEAFENAVKAGAVSDDGKLITVPGPSGETITITADKTLDYAYSITDDNGKVTYYFGDDSTSGFTVTDEGNEEALKQFFIDNTNAVTSIDVTKINDDGTSEPITLSRSASGVVYEVSIGEDGYYHIGEKQYKTSEYTLEDAVAKYEEELATTNQTTEDDTEEGKILKYTWHYQGADFNIEYDEKSKTYSVNGKKIEGASSPSEAIEQGLAQGTVTLPPLDVERQIRIRYNTEDDPHKDLKQQILTANDESVQAMVKSYSKEFYSSEDDSLNDLIKEFEKKVISGGTLSKNELNVVARLNAALESGTNSKLSSALTYILGQNEYNTNELADNAGDVVTNLTNALNNISLDDLGLLNDQLDQLKETLSLLESIDLSNVISTINDIQTVINNKQEGELTLNIKLTDTQEKELSQKINTIIKLITDAKIMPIEPDLSAVTDALNEYTIPEKIMYIRQKIIEANPGTEAKGNTILSNGAHYVNAKGNIALAAGTLMGELGPELVVSGGRYFVAGQNGPEMVNLAKDAIVFNHLQTKSLLEKGNAGGRGKAVTNEKNAVALAKGSLRGGPAKAGVSDTIAQLKQLRAQWQALAGLGVQDLTKKAGGGGGGGDNGQFLENVERWYNWLQKIAQLEKEINYEEAKRNRIASDFDPDGAEYYKSQRKTLKDITSELETQKSLRDSQQAYFKEHLNDVNGEGNPLSKFYKIDEHGQLKYSDTTFTYNGKTFEGGFAALSEINKTDIHGNQVYDTKQQLDMMKAFLGADIVDQYYSKEQDGTQRTEDQILSAIWENMESNRTEFQGLYDSIMELDTNIEGNLQKQNEILQEIENNQISVENRVLAAIEDSRQRMIDEQKKERDAIETTNNALINGLTNALNKERQMYENSESDKELTSLQRKLNILQRSGGSASEISSLQNEINNKQKDIYFDTQQQQIDALQEASDKQLERLDRQIELEEETLEYQKQHGLLWEQVKNIMKGSPTDIADFIEKNDSKHWEESPTAFAQSNRKILFEAEQWRAFAEQDGVAGIKGLVEELVEENHSDDIAALYKDLLGREGTEEEINYWRQQLNNGTSMEDIETTFKNSDEYRGIKASQATVENTVQEPTQGAATVTGTQQWKYEQVDNKQHRSYQKMTDGTWKNQGLHPHNWENGVCKQCKATQLDAISEENKAKIIEDTKNDILIQSVLNRGSTSKTQNKFSKAIKVPGAAEGAFVKQGGLAQIHSNELVLTAEQTSFLREQMLGNRSNSLINLLSDLSAAYGNISNSTVNNSDNINSIVIEHAEVNMKVDKLADSYDASKAADDVMREMLNIARKTSAQNRIGR